MFLSILIPKTEWLNGNNFISTSYKFLQGNLVPVLEEKLCESAAAYRSTMQLQVAVK
jgi:hypothetical protein